MKIKRASAFTMESGQKKPLLDIAEYSNFKYGHKPTVLTFAKKMTDELFSIFPIQKLISQQENVIVTTSPYWYTPPSVHPLALAVYENINEHLFERGKNSLRFIKMSRSSAPSCDFSKLSHAERKLNMQQNKLSVDENAVKGRTVIFIEDARITGAHEAKALECLEAAGAEKVILLYIIDVKHGKKDPDIENRINHSVINSLDELYRLMKNPDEYVLNSRACRFVLSWENKEELEKFAQKLPLTVLTELYSASITDGYGLMEKYADGFRIIREEVRERSHASFIAELFTRAGNLIKKSAVTSLF